MAISCWGAALAGFLVGIAVGKPTVLSLKRKSPRKKVLVSGCYDLLHSGHVEFFNTAAAFGDLYVCVGKDDTIEALKGRPPMFPQDERLLMVRSLKSVFCAEFEEEGGLFGFMPNLRRIKPDIFVVNHDSSGIEDKRRLCAQEGVKFVLLPRKPPEGLPPRSSTAIKTLLKQPAEAKSETRIVVGVLGDFPRITSRDLEFFQNSQVYGTELHVFLTSELDDDIVDEDLLLVRSLAMVKKAYRVGSDWQSALRGPHRPNIVVERAGNPLLPKIKQACSEENVKLMVLDEVGSAWEQEPPYRLCLAGGWMDQPWVSSLAQGSVIVVNIFPMQFNERSGMATSSRKLWLGPLWEQRVLKHAPEQLAKLLFGYENQPGVKYVSGSQDHLGLSLPGISRLVYDGAYWPKEISRVTDSATAAWLESVLALVEDNGRDPDYDPLAEKNLTQEVAARLGLAGDQCWEAILEKNIAKLGAALTATHQAWHEMLPSTSSPRIETLCASYRQQEGVFGAITSGAGGGYILLAADTLPDGAFRVKVRTTWDGEQV